MALNSTISFKVTSSGGNITLDSSNMPDLIFINSAGGFSLANSFQLAYSSLPALGTSWRVFYNVGSGISLNSFTFNIFTVSIPQDELSPNQVNGWYNFVVVANGSGSPTLQYTKAPYVSNEIFDGTLPLTALENLTSGDVIVGNSSNVPTAVSLTGDINISNTGVTTIQNSTVTNVKINPAANNSAKVTDNSGAVNDIVLNTGHVLGNTGSGIAAIVYNPWNLTGNAGTTPGTNFIGTTDANNLVFKVNNLLAGTISTLSPGNVSLGLQSLQALTTGNGNVSIGTQSSYSNTTGYYNTVVGSQAFYRNTTGNNNTIIGNTAAQYVTTANNLVAVGASSLGNNTSGGNNTAIGYLAGNTNATGSNNTYIGYQADAGANNLSNSIALGNQAIVDVSNQFALPDTVTSIKWRGVTYTLPSVQGAAGTKLTNDGSGNLSWT